MEPLHHHAIAAHRQELVRRAEVARSRTGVAQYWSRAGANDEQPTDRTRDRARGASGRARPTLPRGGRPSSSSRVSRASARAGCSMSWCDQAADGRRPSPARRLRRARRRGAPLRPVRRRPAPPGPHRRPSASPISRRRCAASSPASRPELGTHAQRHRRATARRRSPRAACSKRCSRCSSASAADRPTLLVIEDLHWADRSTRSFLPFLASEPAVRAAARRAQLPHRGAAPPPPPAPAARRARARLARAADRARAARPRRAARPADRHPRRRPGAGARRAAVRPQPGQPAVRRGAARGGPRRPRPGAADPARGAARARRAPVAADPGGARDPRRRPARRRGAARRDEPPRGGGAARRAARGDRQPDRHRPRRRRLRVPPRAAARGLHDGLLPGERSECHRAMAAALEDRLADGDKRAEMYFAASIASHYAAAGDQPAALGACIAPPTRRSDLYAYGEAADMLERALELWSRVPDPETHAGADHAKRARPGWDRQPQRRRRPARAAPDTRGGRRDRRRRRPAPRRRGARPAVARALRPRATQPRQPTRWTRGLALLAPDDPGPERPALLTRRAAPADAAVVLRRGGRGGRRGDRRDQRDRRRSRARSIALQLSGATNAKGTALMSLGFEDEGERTLREAIALAERRPRRAGQRLHQPRRQPAPRGRTARRRWRSPRRASRASPGRRSLPLARR